MIDDILDLHLNPKSQPQEPAINSASENTTAANADDILNDFDALGLFFCFFYAKRHN